MGMDAIDQRMVWMAGKIGMIKYTWVCAFVPLDNRGKEGKLFTKTWEGFGIMFVKSERERIHEALRTMQS